MNGKGDLQKQGSQNYDLVIKCVIPCIESEGHPSVLFDNKKGDFFKAANSGQSILVYKTAVASHICAANSGYLASIPLISHGIYPYIQN